MKTFTKRLLLVLATFIIVSFGASCSTLHGIGHDVEKVGNKIQHVGN